MTTSQNTYPDCWVFDGNRRKYRLKNGYTVGNPIWREHWCKVTIVGETSRSWLTSCRRKIPKAGREGVSFSMEEIERLAFVEENRYWIGDAVSRLKDYGALKSIADLIRYEVESK